jgi:ubiquinone/menaquinone biosynthesis C-methylase UbiE
VTAPDDRYWNHNAHYQRLVLNAVPPGCGPAIDVGCGDGMLARRLAARCGPVTGIDRDAAMVALARDLTPAAAGVSFIQGDFLACPLDPASFDFACANTSLHHMDFAAALAKMARILRPGGRLVVIGLGADRSPADWARAAIAFPVNQWYRRTRGERYSAAPTMAPDMSWSAVRDRARRVLPGARYRRLLLWRYAVIWDKPAP